MRRWRMALAALLFGFAMPAAAETLTIAANDPPERANVNDLVRIAVDRFEGEDGAEFAQGIEAALGTVRFGNRPYFRMIGLETGAAYDAIVTGSAKTALSESNVTEKRKRCVEKDPANRDKCLKEDEVDIRCRRRIVTVSSTVRLAAVADGSVRYSRPLVTRDEQNICPDRQASRTIEDFVAEALRGQVDTIRRDVAPRAYTIDVRVDENRKGLDKPVAEAFKAAVRQTKTDPAGACDAWAAMTRDAEPTAALAFNLGLCAEQRGDFVAAGDWYGQAQRLGSKSRDIPAAFERMARTQRALADWEARQRLMDGN